MICFEVLCLPAYDFGKPGPIKSDVFLNFANGAGPSSIKKNSGRFLDALREGFKEKNQVKKVIHQSRGGGHPEPKSIFERRKKGFFQGPHRTILEHPKHALHLVPSIKFIVKKSNVI